MWEGRRGLETSFIKLSGRSPWASLAGPWRLPVPRQEGQTRLLSWEGRRGGCGLQSRAEGGSHPRLTPELGMQLWGPSIPSPSWRMPPLRARVEENGYRCVLPAPGSWDLLGSAPCPGRRVGGMGRGSSPGRLGTGCGTGGDPGPPAGQRFVMQSREEPCQFPRGRTVGTLPGSVGGTGFLRKREALPSVPARGHQSEFSRGSLLARCPQKCRRRRRAPGCFLPPRPGSPGQGTWRWLRLVL